MTPLQNKTEEDRQAILNGVETTLTNAASAAQTTANTAVTNAAAAQTTANGAQPKTGNTFTVATLPAASANVGRTVYCSNGSAGSPCGAISDGTNWKVVALGATVATE